jgi:tetratricopeptide (TPR) repeat protein
MPEGPAPLPCVFVSAVSSELSAARQLVANCLLVLYNVDVAYQEEFGKQSGDLLPALRRGIDDSIGVLQLVGDAFGGAPPADDRQSRQISFTQYEFLYAYERQENRKLTWLIQVKGSCTRDVNAPEFVVGDGADVSPETARLLDVYRARLSATAPGSSIVARPSDDDVLKRLIDTHNQRRQWQRDYYAGLHAHLRYTADNDDELVKCIRELKGLPRVGAREKFKNVAVEPALRDGFIGQARLMYEVLALLRQPDYSHARIVLQGLGGCGKTRVASEIGHAYHTIGHHVFRIKPTPGREIDEALETLVKGLNVEGVSDAQGLRTWLGDHADWLMIVDGVDDGDTAGKVEQFCGEFTGGAFLITSYLRGYWDNRPFVKKDLEELQIADAHRLLRRLLAGGSRPVDPEQDTLTLARLLGGLPLAIEHANGYLGHNDNFFESVKDYVVKLEKASVLPEATESELRAVPKPISATWQTSLERMRPSTRTFLRLVSFLTDDPIPIGLIKSPEVARVFARACAADPLEQWPDRPLPDESDVVGWTKELGSAISQLLDYSLLRWHDTKRKTHLRAHRLVLVMTQASLRTVTVQVLRAGLELQHTLASLEPASAVDVRGSFLVHAIRFLTDYLAREGTEGRKQIYPHLFHLASLYLDRRKALEEARTPLGLAPDELIFLGELFSLMGAGREADAVEHHARAATMATATPYERAKASQCAGWACFQASLIADAWQHYARAEQAVDGQPNDERHDDVRYEIHSGRGWVYRFIGDLDAAITDLTTALEVAERGTDLGRVADACINLGGTYDYAGDDDVARGWYAKAVERADESDDANVRGLARYMGGWFLIRRGPFEEGMALCGEALTIGETFKFGDVRGEAAWILAIGHALAGRLEQALALADRAAERPTAFVSAWVLMIRGIMRVRAGRRDDAADDFTNAIARCDEEIGAFENFDPLDTRAFAHAGLALLGFTGHEDLAVQDYQRARELASARGIVDIGKTVFSCFGSTPPVERMANRLFGNA